MRLTHILPIAAAVSFAFLAGCSKPASQTAVDASTTPTTAADSSASGGVVSPPHANGAINTDANKTSSDVSPASNSFTEGQAKGHIENAGYTDVTNLVKTPDGMWTAKAMKGGKAVDVAVDFKGAVTAK